ncbi:glycine-rich protein DC7.1-like [Apium graveolens]|uniref:glycine-rich protein DC7.1-like n=1 Tax=Apium graveolens TaxID=4045 RepID=UPI003D794AA3
MGSKIFLLLGLSIAFALLISSEVAARDLAETTSKTDGAGLDGGYHGGGGHYNGGGGHGGGGGGHYNGGGSHHGGGGGGCRHYCHGRCCSAAEEAALEGATLDGGYHGGGGGHYNGGGSHHGGGGGGGHYNGGGSHHGGGGGGCRHYCHGRCCSAAEEATLKATEAKPQN